MKHILKILIVCIISPKSISRREKKHFRVDFILIGLLKGEKLIKIKIKIKEASFYLEIFQFELFILKYF